MTKQTILLDLDDTLIHCNKYFKETVDTYISKMQEWFPISKYEIREKQLEFDLESVANYGLHSARFPQSFVSTYKYYSEKFNLDIKTQHIDEVYTIGASVFEIEVQPLPGMYDVLNQLTQQGHALYLYTGGDHSNQNRKIVSLELETYFQDRVFIFEHKNTASLKQVLSKINSRPSSTWMIGNSLKTDIKPAIEVGINAIHIPSELEWAYNNIELEEKYYTLNSLQEVPNYMRQLSQRNLTS